MIANEHLGALRSCPEVEVGAVCDLSAVMAEALAERFEVPRFFTDHLRMLAEVEPDVVHVTTSANSHFALATDALDAGAHVFVEKPAATSCADVHALLNQASQAGLFVIEDYNYLFNAPVRRLRNLVDSGEFGDVVHVDVFMSLEVLARGNPFVDPNLPHPILLLPRGVIADFLPHLASFAHRFAGPHESASAVWQKRDPASPLPSDEFRALIKTRSATATIGFSAHSRPEGFYLRVLGTKMRATGNLFEHGLTIQPLRSLPRPLTSLVNGLAEARDAGRNAVVGLWRKLEGGPGTYDGLWRLIAETYAALGAGVEPPVSPHDIAAVHRLIHDVADEANAL